MKNRQLNKDGLTVSAMGLGYMGMSDFYGTRDDNEAIAIQNVRQLLNFNR